MVGLGCLATLMWGCASAPLGSGLSGDPQVDEIHLLTMPMALNLDQAPGADGFAVKIYAIDQARPKSVAITSGTLEIRMYDGALVAGALATNTPVSVWPFSASELAAYRLKTSVGYVYALTPTWREDRPRREKITVTACYEPAESNRDRPRVCSLPTTVTVSLPASFK